MLLYMNRILKEQNGGVPGREKKRPGSFVGRNKSEAFKRFVATDHCPLCGSRN